MKPDMSVDFAGINFKNPITVASGTFGFGREYSRFYDLSRLGGICVKGLTLKKREGNPPPRIAETPMGILNSVGLQNPGVEAFIKYELPFLRSFDTRIIANIAGDTIDEYAEMARLLSASGVDLLEVNISCPNVHQSGIPFGSDPAAAAAVTKAVKNAATVPVMVKLSPNVTDITSIALACEDAGADALSLINTLLGMMIDVEAERPLLRNITGGLSGPAIFPVALRMVWQVCSKVNIPVMGMGGVSSGNDCVAMLLAGASAVSVGTASFKNPTAPLDILEQTEQYLTRKLKYSLSEIIGSLKPISD